MDGGAWGATRDMTWWLNTDNYGKQCGGSWKTESRVYKWSSIPTLGLHLGGAMAQKGTYTTVFIEHRLLYSRHVAFPSSRLFTSGGQSIGTSASASVLPMNIQGWFSLDGLVWSPCCPRDPQESSPTPQFKSINSSVLSFLYGPTLTFVHDY